MTLGRRAVLLIFPVVLISYALAAATLYVVERSALLRLEQVHLQQQIEQIDILYQNEETVARSLLTALLTTSSFRSFLQETDESFRANALASRMEATLRSLSTSPDDFVSLAVISSDMRVVYYGENSLDPFAEIDPVQLSHTRTFTGRNSRFGVAILVDGHAGPLLIVTRLIDPVSMDEPVGTRGLAAYQVQVAVRPIRFASAMRDLEETYQAIPEIGREKLEEAAGLSATGAVGRDLFVRLTPAPEYFDKRMREVGLLLSGGVLVMSLLSVSLLILLVRRFITRPVAELDAQVTSVMNGTRNQLERQGRSGEVAHLSDNVKKLHDTVTASLEDVKRSLHTDALTGLSNRAHFTAVASEAIASALETGVPRTLLFMDVDHFKFVNDRFGHETGDRLLKALATSLQAVLRSRNDTPDIVARLSGDEFAALLPMTAADARILADTILRLFYQGFMVDGQRYPIGLSIGIASCPEHATGLDELVANADAAMYEAKAHGRNAHVCFSAEISTLRGRTRLIQNELRSLDPDHEFHLLYMPVVDRNGLVSGCEALLRWNSPSLGQVRPDEFVPIAELNGLFDKIDRWVIDRAFQDWNVLSGWFGPGFGLSINVSSAQLRASTLLPYLKDRSAAHAVPAGRIEIELTETFAIEGGQSVSGSIAALREGGYRVAIDDFGAGFTCIRQIIDYRADTIKLDRQFLEGLFANHAQRTLDAVVSLCHAEGMTVVGEGVDSEGKRAMLMEAGCDLYQGFGISPPLPIDDLGLWALQQLATAGRGASATERRQDLIAEGGDVVVDCPRHP